MLKEAAFVPPNETAVAVVKLVPVITTVAPVAAFAGAKDEIVGICARVPRLRKRRNATVMDFINIFKNVLLIV